ncbi:MAG: hypothetical protein HKN71_06345 [Gemmatimonadetes bacterium]|nr:hypothetical protein [Gemmatimonadota bacterium]
MTRHTALFMILLGGLAFSGCGGGDAPAVDEGADTGTETPATAGLVDPDMGDFPIPAPPGALREPMIQLNARIIMYPAGERQRLIDFYDEWTASEVDEYRRLGEGEEGINWDNSGPEGESPTRTIAVSPHNDRERPAVVTLGAN